LQLPIRCKCGFCDRYGKYVVNGAAVSMPTLPRRAARYLSAVTRWQLAGRPTRTDAEVIQIVNEHCQWCDYFKDKHCSHAGCGCNIRTPDEESNSLFGKLSGALANKVRMGTEGCPIGKWGPSKVHVLIVVTSKRPTWCKEADFLRLGLLAHCIGYESGKRIADLVREYNPSLVVNRSFAVPAKDVDKLAEAFPRTQFATVNHSSQSHLMLAASHLTAQSDFLDLAKARGNCWLACPDERNYLGEVTGIARCVALPNPVMLPTYMSKRVRGETLHLSLICRRDMIKNIPQQIMAAAMVAKRQPTKLWLVIRDKTDDLMRYAEHMGIETELVEWMDEPRELRSWLAETIDIGLQVSFSESFNFVAVDHLGLGIPVVGSPAIRYLPIEWQAQADSSADIADRIIAVSQDQEVRNKARKIAEQVAERNNEAFARTILALVGVSDVAAAAGTL
jgi:hypothetical protein